MDRLLGRLINSLTDIIITIIVSEIFGGKGSFMWSTVSMVIH